MKGVCCSSPGKVLMTGGYMVLDRPNTGLVLTVNARMYCSVVPLGSDDQMDVIEVHSPQFSMMASYDVIVESKWVTLRKRDINQKTNPYTERTIVFTLNFISRSVPNWRGQLARGLKISLVADNDFYSQRSQLEARNLPASSASLASLEKCLPVLTSMDDLKKTGLGSSATLVSSLVGALLSYFDAVKVRSISEPRSPVSNVDLRIVHNLAQICHCAAQGKIGSGFDVSSAVYGSQIYTRFSPDIIAPLLEEGYCDPDHLVEIVKSDRWDNKVESFALPKGFRLLLGDPSHGSNTPNMVSKVLAWKRKTDEKGQAIIRQLISHNKKVEDLFGELSDALEQLNAADDIRSCSRISASEWGSLTGGTVIKKMRDIETEFSNVRRHLRLMGDAADVDIEPISQTNLIDATLKVPGVFISGVPGAGGHDAIFSVLMKDSNALSQVEDLWFTHSVLPLIVEEDASGIAIDQFPYGHNHQSQEETKVFNFQSTRGTASSIPLQQESSWLPMIGIFALVGAGAAMAYYLRRR
eukprot:TRINITY_DN195_c1_g1_i1.p1 TRINITY_DN195_c1_g1~~TRINITY_DN195_c1_g1_i1.p1  ORF type:complete len:525 (-),score=77.57 TRINITY_DN195_c1_g1_i1:66-1640(-)